MATVRHLGFLEIHFLRFEAIRGSICVTLSNFMPIGQTVAKIWPIFIF